jgi:aerobic C4-dicarboxylate transport protein
VVATLVVARWEGAFDARAAREFLAAPREAQAQHQAQGKPTTVRPGLEETRHPAAHPLLEKAAK